MRTIALEEHYVTPEYMASEGRWLEPYQQVVRPLLDSERAGSRRWTPAVSTSPCCP